MAEQARAGMDGRRRVVVEGVSPEIDGGEFPAKRVVGEDVVVEADVFCDGHEVLAAVIRHRRAGDRSWQEAPMELLESDRWRGSFTVTEMGRHRFTVRAWLDRFATWRRDIGKKIDAGQDVSVELLTGAELVEAGAKRGRGEGKLLRRFAARLRDGDPDAALDDELAEAMTRVPDRSGAVTFERELDVLVDAPRARFSS